MPKKSDFVRSMEAKIGEAESRAKKFDEASMKARAEVKAYKECIEWFNNTKKERKIK